MLGSRVTHRCGSYFMTVIINVEVDVQCIKNSVFCNQTGVGSSPECDLCLPNYAGLHCDECIAGFYKSSKDCIPCECNGNADPEGPAQICHPDTGHCLRCTNNATGSRCHLCAPGFFGDAKAHNCTRPGELPPQCSFLKIPSTKTKVQFNFD